MESSERAQALGTLLDCSSESAEALAAVMIPKNFPAKTVITHQGDTNIHLWLILAGSVQLQTLSIEGQITVISSFGPGELVGVFPEEDECEFDICAVGRVQTLQVPAPVLKQLMSQYSDLGSGLAAIFAGQLDTVLDRLSARVTLSAAGRVYRELLRMAGDGEVISPPPLVSALALTAQTARETGSRALSTLERRGIINRDNQKITIVSRRMLEDLVV